MTSRLDALNRWLGVTSNLGVIGGFILLAVQMQQNTRALELETARSLNLEAQAAELAVMGDDAATAYAESILRPAQLSPGDLVRLWAYLNGGLQPALNTWIAWNQGSATRENWEAARLSAASSNDSRVSRIIWDEIKDAQLPPGFVTELDEALERSEPFRNDRMVLSVLRKLRALEAPDLEAAAAPSREPSGQIAQ